MEKHEKERVRLVEAARQLEEAMEEVVKASEERENEHQVQIDDLSAQVGDGRRVDDVGLLGGAWRDGAGGRGVDDGLLGGA